MRLERPVCRVLAPGWWFFGVTVSPDLPSVGGVGGGKIQRWRSRLGPAARWLGDSLLIWGQSLKRIEWQ